MELLTFVFALALGIGLVILFWMKYTKSGRRWVEGDY